MDLGGDDDERRRRVLTFELEAAEALAGLARSSSSNLGGGRHHQNVAQADEATNARQFCGNAAVTVAAGPAMTPVDTTFPQTCVAIHNQSKVSGSSRQKRTEAEKEARRIRRVLANRESARQTIRRRQQVMHLELTGKASDLKEVNVYLKKVMSLYLFNFRKYGEQYMCFFGDDNSANQEKELAMKKYNYLKDENECLKAQVVAKRRQAEPENIQKQSKSPCITDRVSRSAAANAPFFLCSQPSVFPPFFWPAHIPSTGLASTSGSTSALPFHFPMWDELCSNHGLISCSSGITTKPEAPLFIMPVPWLLPFLTHHCLRELSSEANDAQRGSSSTHQCCVCSSLATSMHENYHRFSSQQNTSASNINAPKFPSDGGKGPQIHPKSATLDHRPSVPKQMMHIGSLEKTRQGQLSTYLSRKWMDVVAAAAKARRRRRRRKEVLRLRNIQGNNSH